MKAKLLIVLYCEIILYRDPSPMSENRQGYSPASSSFSGSARSSPTPSNTDLIAELKKAAVTPSLKKTKKPNEEGKMNFIYSFGGPVKTGVVTNGDGNHNSSQHSDKAREMFQGSVFSLPCLLKRSL